MTRSVLPHPGPLAAGSPASPTALEPAVFPGAAQAARPRRVEHRQTDRGLLPVYATGVVEQPWETYTAEDHATWSRLYVRQHAALRDRVVPELYEGLDLLGIGPDAIPRMADVSRRLETLTGFTLVGVEGLLPDAVFFDHLAARRFPATWWIRRPDALDYVSEPDLFHDMFGHVPLLTHPGYAAFAQRFGELGRAALAAGGSALDRLSRLYWFSIEFGLVKAAPSASGGGSDLRIYGAGIASSYAESLRALTDASIARVPFERDVAAGSSFQIDRMQSTYFVLDRLDTLASLLDGAERWLLHEAA